MRKFLLLAEIPVHYLVGGHHSAVHRMVCGTILMCVGVVVIHVGQGAMLAELLGATMHGLGLVPFAERYGHV